MPGSLMPTLTTYERPKCGTSAADEQPGGKPRKRVLLADDNRAILSIVRDLLEPEFAVVGAFTDGNSVLAEVAELKPDIVILDVSLGDPDGFTVARQLQSACYHSRIVFLTVHEIGEFVRMALAAGAVGYVFKSRLTTDLIPALHAASGGRLFVSCQI